MISHTELLIFHLNLSVQHVEVISAYLRERCYLSKTGTLGLHVDFRTIEPYWYMLEKLILGLL